MAKAPVKKGKAPAVTLVVVKKNGSGKKMRGKCDDEDDMDEYRKGGLVRKKKGK